ncbi:rhamnulokinase [Acerihabitans sp. TG2]|uniref:rhamnulokinase n=1 Tax=Acerihabitans sp. TG2 TaxID=3096008 RepID=UPI002B23404D|nr:rhamnulokinase [Acerihabitans sp. TG2]MEA9391598.1 rhamnulokinase [Acerihabitans sp. TG2]
MTIRNLAAIDLGASSGRVMLANWQSDAQTLTLTQIHRFTNGFTPVAGQDCWDLDQLEQEIVTGLVKLDNQLDNHGVRLDGIGIDTWGVDYVLLDPQGKRLGNAVSYRDHRTEGVMARVTAALSRQMLYRHTGIQFLPFNTLFQLKALCEQQPDIVEKTAHFLMIPDYFTYRLTGKMNREYTNASTTQMLNLATGDWDQRLLDYLGIPRRWFGTPRLPGNTVGQWTSPTGCSVPVIAVASHDTASAVVAAPLKDRHSAYLSSGTWSLIGFESDKPYNNDAALAANITNEGGVSGTFRVLKNIMGLWLLQRICLELSIADLPALIARAAACPPFASLINPNDPRFLNPPSMAQAIRDACQETGQPVPQDDAALARVILDSLALCYRQVLQELSALRGAELDHLYIVGGGCQNQLLNQLCADICQIPVTAGPVEATTLGNVGCQLMTLGDVADLAGWRQIVARSFTACQFLPQPLPGLDDIWQRFQHISH